MFQVRAKFKCSEVTETESGKKVVLYPVISGSEENKAFFKWTPSGKLEMGIMNDGAANEFKPGQEYYVDFTKAE
jgi:hypothetical protein